MANYFDGCVAEFVIYDRALSAAEIAQVEDYLRQRYYAPAPVTVQGTVALNGFLGSYSAAGVSVEFRPVGGGAAFTRAVLLDEDVPSGSMRFPLGLIT